MIDRASLERFYFEYQTEWVPRGMSIQAFCVKNNVPYRVMERYIRELHSRVHPVKVVGVPEGGEGEPEAEMVRQSGPGARPVGEESHGGGVGWISVSICLGSGLSLSHRVRDYMELKMLVDKLEMLC